MGGAVASAWVVAVAVEGIRSYGLGLSGALHAAGLTVIEIEQPHHELTTTRTSQINRLRALLLVGDDTDRTLSRSSLTPATLDTIADRDSQPGDTRERTIRRGGIRRLARVIRDIGRELVDSGKQLSTVV
ncbi:hypothetical protein [Bounagaea algeriensis]